MIHIVLWKWQQANNRTLYESEHVDIMCSMLERNIPKQIKYRIICITDNADGISGCQPYALWQDGNDLDNATKPHLPSCYRRLKLYDRQTQESLHIDKGDRILSLDVDTLICGDISGILRTEGRFVGWELPGEHHPRVFNGSLQMFTAGDLQHIWSDFDPAVSPKETFEKGWKGSDQAWLSRNLIDKEGSVGLTWPLVASYPLQTKLQGLHSARTRIMFFHGSIKPWYPQAVADTPWVARYWRL